MTESEPAHDIGAIREAITAHMTRTGMRAKELSQKAGLNETAVRDLMQKVDDPRIGTLTKLAVALGCSPSTLFGGLVQVSGTIGEGGGVTAAPEPVQFVARPPEAVGELLAYRVSGTHLMPAYRDGDVVYCARDDQTAVDDCIGEECVMQLAGSGALVFKTLAYGRTPNHFTLRSFNAADVADVSLAWVAPVLFVMRSRLTRVNNS